MRRRLSIATIVLCLYLGTAGSIAEQRARLPPPADCSDPVVGVWKSHDHFIRHGHWYETWLHIQRVPGDQTRLTGHMDVHMWLGSQTMEQPPTCDETVLRYRIRQPAEGAIDGSNNVEFHGTSYELTEQICGVFTSYNLDAFSGTIDPDLQEFQSLNNDGGLAVNFPSVFRRISCGDEPPADKEPDSTVAPPPFQPPASGGCSGWW